MLEILKDTPFAGRLVSAENIIRALRGRKTPAELELIRTAINITENIFEETFHFAAINMSEVEVADFMHRRLDDHDLDPAWSYEGCPIVNTGPDSPGRTCRAGSRPHPARAYSAY